MKFLLILVLSLSAFNLIAAELGEDKKSECPFTHQSNKREAKKVEPIETQAPSQEKASTISK